MTNIPWSTLELFLDAKGDRPRPKVFYLDGSLELMSPSTNHEHIKTHLGRIIEAYLLHLGIEFNGFGAWTVRNKRGKAVLEPDECYLLEPGTGSQEAAGLRARSHLDERWYRQARGLRAHRCSGSVVLAERKDHRPRPHGVGIPAACTQRVRARARLRENLSAARDRRPEHALQASLRRVSTEAVTHSTRGALNVFSPRANTRRATLSPSFWNAATACSDSMKNSLSESGMRRWRGSPGPSM